MEWREKIKILTKERSIWRGELVSFEEFVESDNFCNHPKLSKVQYEEVEKLIGSDPKLIFTPERKKKIAIWVWGKGSGKGTTSSLLMLYGCYVLLNMTDCHTYFKLAKADPLSIVNVALSWDQSDRFFMRLRNRLLGNKWFRKYRIYDENKYVKDSGKEFNECINIVAKQINLMDKIQVLSLHSQKEKWEDLTIIMWVADEMCLMKGTMVTDVVTGVTKPIEEWKEGINVEAFDFLNNKVVVAKSGMPFFKGIGRVIEIVTESGKRITVAEKHRVYVGSCWKCVNELKAGDSIFVKSGKYNYYERRDRVMDICFFEKVVKIKEFSDKVEYYDFVVPKYHNYFLNGILNHNSGFTSDKGLYNAKQIWDTLVASTRELPYIGVVTSWPRLSEEEDFTYKKYKEALSDPDGDIVASLYPTFKVKPSHFYCGETFNFVINERSGETIAVPIELREYAKEPEVFKARFLCIPGAETVGDFFQYTEELYKIRTVKPVVKTIDKEIVIQGKKKLQKEIISMEPDLIPRVIALDAGEKDCEASLVMMRENETIVNGEIITEFIVDGIIVWTPNYKEALIVDLKNYLDVIVQLTKAFNIVNIRLDQWNSAMIGAMLDELNIQYEVKNMDYDSYAKLRTVVYGHGLVLAEQVDQCYNYNGDVVTIDRVKEFILQCKLLKSKGVRKPRVQIGRQDLCDSVVQGIDYFFSKEREYSDEDVIAAVIKFPGSLQQHQVSSEQKDFLFGKNRAENIANFSGRRSKEEDDDWFKIV